jgi:hypothetical protein
MYGRLQAPVVKDLGKSQKRPHPQARKDQDPSQSKIPSHPQKDIGPQINPEKLAVKTPDLNLNPLKVEKTR